MALIHEFFWKGDVRPIGDGGLEWPALPGWTDAELVDSAPGGLVRLMKLPGKWLHCFVHTAAHQLKYQAKLLATDGVVSESMLPDEEYEVDEWDKETEQLVKAWRKIQKIAEKGKYV